MTARRQGIQPFGPPNRCRNGGCGELVEMFCRFQHYCCGCAASNLGLRDGERALRITMALRLRRRLVGRLLHQHLANPEEFAPADGFMVSTTSLDDLSCDGSQYWRGNVWGIVNFFVHCGVREYLKTAPGDAVAWAMADRIRDSMFELLDEADFYEYFHTKQVDEQPRGYGVPSFGWNGLALFMDREPAFGSLGKTTEIAEGTEGF